MNKNIAVDVAQLVWLAACLVANHLYHLASSRSEAVSVAFFVVMGGGIIAIGQLARRKR
jgi:hypothetical protein